MQNNAGSTADPVNESYIGPIIDMHIHAFDEGSSEYGQEFENELTGKKYYSPPSALSHREQTFDKFKKYNIVKALVSSNTSNVGGEPSRKWAEFAPEKVIIGNNHRIAPETLRELFYNNQLHALAEVAPYYEGILPTDERLKPFFYLAEELDIPVGFHLLPGGPPGTAYEFAPNSRAIHANPLQFEEILLAHPKMRIFIMHAAWPYLDDMKALMYAHPQVYVETGVIDWLLPTKGFHNYLKELVDSGFGNRIMFGTDQMVWVEAIDDAVNAINSANFLTLDQKADIFYNNAARFLRLTDEEIAKHHEGS